MNSKDPGLSDIGPTAEIFAPSEGRVRWSAHAVDVTTGRILFSHHPDRVLDTASVGKIFLLLATAEMANRGELDFTEPLRLLPLDAFDDSGLWHTMLSSSLPIYDLGVLIGAVSDNQATNVLLRRVGIDAVHRAAEAVGMRSSFLHDSVRWPILSGDPQTLSSGSARELASCMAAISSHRALSEATSRTVETWLAGDTDCSMVASAFGLDPLAHRTADRGIQLYHKTGTTSSVRADIGIIKTSSRQIAYAVLANWDRSGEDLRDEVLTTMRKAGAIILHDVTNTPPSHPSRPRALIVVNDPESGPRAIPSFLDAAGVDAVVRDATVAPLPESLDGFAALVMLGGGIMPNQDADAPWLPAERTLAAQAIERDIPTLGICLGAQILAHTAGGYVHPDGPHPERGLTEITLLETAAGDPLLAPLGSTAYFMENHRDFVETLPDRATLLAQSDRCAVQAFRFGSSVWGVQFHPEVPPERALQLDPARLDADGFDPAAVKSFARTHADEARAGSRALLTGFARIVANTSHTGHTQAAR